MLSSSQLGNGFRALLRKSWISSGTFSLLLPNSSITRHSPASSHSYHSGGISSAAFHTFSIGISLILVSHGSKLSHPFTPSYTAFLAYTPRNGASGNVHSCALKQYPWSTNVTL